MSIKTWKTEFYPIAAVQLANSLDSVCIEHSIQKWKGLLPKNLQKHGLKKDHFTISDTRSEFNFDAYSCALCQKYDDIEENKLCYSKLLKKQCPLYQFLGRPCDESTINENEIVTESLFRTSATDPQAMIKALKATLNANLTTKRSKRLEIKNES